MAQEIYQKEYKNERASFTGARLFLIKNGNHCSSL